MLHLLEQMLDDLENGHMLKVVVSGEIPPNVVLSYRREHITIVEKMPVNQSPADWYKEGTNHTLHQGHMIRKRNVERNVASFTSLEDFNRLLNSGHTVRFSKEFGLLILRFC